MAQQENKITLSKKAQREISPFFGHEMLYDYLCGNLDKDRRSAVEDHVKFSRDAQLDLAKIQEGQQYAEKLSQTVVSQPIITQINTPTSYFSVLLKKSNFDRWPQGVKWGLEALVVVLAIVTVLTVTPWEKVMQVGVTSGSREVVLAEISKDEAPAIVEEKPEFIDEGVKEKEAESEAAAHPAPPTTPARSAPATPSPTPAPSVQAKVEKPGTEVVNAPVVAGGGFLYRGEIAVTNVDAARIKITEKINELGGRKAGSVELGWKKTPTSSYYHFTIPEAKYQDLVTFLSSYGKAKLVKEKHPRVMPDGIVRLIITVDEAKK